MLRYYIFLIGGVLLVNSLHGQIPLRAKGLNYNPIEYQQRAQKSAFNDQRGRPVPLRLSLKPFCPTPRDQGMEPSCTAWAMAYGVLSIQQAIALKVRQNADVDKIACSKSFVYNELIATAMTETPTIEATFDFMKQQGTCLASTFSNDHPASIRPDELARIEALNYRLADMTEVYDPNPGADQGRQLRRLKRLLADSGPVVVGLRLPYLFSNLQQLRFHCDPNEPLDSAAHAMCLIGYDDIDSTFELMNSWGTNWGEQGFVRIGYRDFMSFLCCAYRLTPYFSIERQRLFSKSSFVLRSSTKTPEVAGKSEFEEVRVYLDTATNIYQTQVAEWPVGSLFQLALRRLPAHCWVSIQNINQYGEINELYTGQIDGSQVEQLVPGDNIAVSMEDRGFEWIVVAYALQPMAADKSWLTELNKLSTPDDQRIQAVLQQHFGNAVARTPERMGFMVKTARNTPAQRSGYLLLKLKIL